MRYLTKTLWFPTISEASEEGIIAIGGDLSTERLMLAYRSGIFPWYEDGQPIIWWSPDPRMVLFPENFKLSKSLRRTISKKIFRVTFNKAFKEVVSNCANIRRDGQRGTWITSEMQQAYIDLHTLGNAMSVEVWQDDFLVGGLYGVDLSEKKVFCGESMFSKVSDASKVAFYFLNEKLKQKKYSLIDCQVHNAHLESLGAIEIPRKQFLECLK